MEVKKSVSDIETYVNNAETIKHLVLDKLLEDSMITSDIHDLYSTSYNIVVVRPSWFKAWVSKFKKEKLNGFIYKYVKF